MRYIGPVLVLLASLVACGADGGTDEREAVATEWYLRSITGGERTINLVYNMSGVASDCEHKGNATVEETAERVTVTAHKSVTLDRDRACTEEFAYIEESVTLAAPLGSRALVGCRPGNTERSEDDVCRDLERSRQRGVFEFSPAPSS